MYICILFFDKNLIDGNHHIFEGIFRRTWLKKQKRVAVVTFLLVVAWAEDPGLWADPFWETAGVARAFSCLDLWRDQSVMLEPREQTAMRFLDILWTKSLRTTVSALISDFWRGFLMGCKVAVLCCLPLSGDIAILLLRGEGGRSLSAGKYLFLLPLSVCCWTKRNKRSRSSIMHFYIAAWPQCLPYLPCWAG